MGAISKLASIFGIAKLEPNPFEMVEDAFCPGNGRTHGEAVRAKKAKKAKKRAKAARRRNRSK